jgi:hypothetical protein
MKLSLKLLATTFCLVSPHAHSFGISSGRSNKVSLMPRAMGYGPPETGQPLVNDPTPEQIEQFQSVFYQVMNCEVREHLPSIVSGSIDVFVDLRGDTGVGLLNQQVAQVEATGDPELISRAHAAVEYIVYFIEAFIGEAKMMDDNNKRILGNIIKCMLAEENQSMSKDERLDQFMANEMQSFTPGFLRHLEGECVRLQNLQTQTPETARMGQILRVTQARVIEELGKELGEGAQVLGQLLGYETSEERIAVLDAGLQVRGVDFARELKALTEEALQGFQNTPGGVDQNLINIVAEMDYRIAEFINYYS